MIPQEAIEYNKNLKKYMRITDKDSEYKFLKENYEALDMANKALEQSDTLDRIISQIEQTRDKDKLCEYPYNRCINIIKEEIKNENNGNG